MTPRTPPETHPEQNPIIRVAIAAAWCREPLQKPVILVTRRPDHVHLPNLWELPGGKIDPNEDPADAASRELLEETGLTGHQPRHLLTHQHIYDDRIVSLHAFTIQVDQPIHVESNDAITDARWVHAAELSSIEFPPANTPITAACVTFLDAMPDA